VVPVPPSTAGTAHPYIRKHKQIAKNRPKKTRKNSRGCTTAKLPRHTPAAPKAT